MRTGRWLAVGLAAAVAFAADEPTVTIEVRDTPVAAVLAEIARQAGLELVSRGVPEAKMSLRLRGVPLPNALQLVCRQYELTFRVDEGKLIIAPHEADATPPVRPPGLPERLTDQATRLLRAVFDAPADPARETALGRWLWAQRPDWTEPLAAWLAQTWGAWATTAADGLRGGRVLERLGCLSAAIELARAARSEPALECDARLLIARAELERGDPARALGEARRARAADPEEPRAAAMIAAAMLPVQVVGQEALAEAEAAHARWPASADVLATLGDLLRRDENMAGRAAGYLQDALQIDPAQPDARYGLAVLAARDPTESRSAWRAFLDVEPFSPRARRVELELAPIRQIDVAERGGRVWHVTAGGDRVLYTDRFRKQLQITDTRGFGLALQLTDQEAEKTWATLSPDEQTLAWIVDGAVDIVYLQGVNASGHHREIARSSEAGADLRRTAWSPDGRYLLFSEHSRGGRTVRLRCWDHQLGQEVEPPAPLRGIEGLGDVSWASADRVVGTLTRDERVAVVSVAADGSIAMLRPPAELRSYAAPALDPGGRRLIWQDTRTRELMTGRPDGAEAPALPLLSGAAGRETQCAQWLPDGSGVALSLRDLAPTVLLFGGLRRAHRLEVRVDPLTATGRRPPVYEFRVELPRGSAGGALTAAVIDDHDATTWSKRYELRAGSGPPVVTVRPEATGGSHWMRVELTVGEAVDPPRWYRFHVRPDR